MLILWQDTQGRTPNQAFCQQMQAETGLANVVYDPNGQLNGAGLGRTHQHLVMEEGAKIYHRRTGDDSTFARYVDELLAP